MVLRDYNESPEQSAEYLRLALAEMQRHRTPVNPINYTIWYNYVAGRNQALTEDINAIIADGADFSAAKLTRLYRKHFVQDEETLKSMREELRAIVIDALSHLTTAGTDFTRYGTVLRHFADILGHADDTAQLSAEVGTVLTETNRTERSRHMLEDQLHAITSQVEKLNRELEQIREEALTDALTRIANRKAFDTRLENAVDQARELDASMCVLLADIDEFKAFNDRHGHLLGDKVLRFVAGRMSSCLKGKDFPARFGGEEFAIVLPDTPLSGAMVVAEQIRQAVSSGMLKTRESGESLGTVTISLGVAQLRASDTPRDLLRRADAALYSAKQRGRNRVEKEL